MAQRFVFKLDPVLRQRKREEDVRLREVADLRRQQSELERRLQALQASLEDARMELRDRLSSPPHAQRQTGSSPRIIDALRFQTTASLHLVGKAQHVAVELAGVLNRLERARSRLAEATAARRAVELLRERQHEQWKRELARSEQRELDDLTSTRHGRFDNEMTGAST